MPPKGDYSRSKKEYSVTNEEIFQEFIENRRLSESSINGYKLALQKYVDYNGLDLEALIEEADEEEELAVRLRKRKVRKRLLGFKKDLDTKDLSERYKTDLVSLVRSFYNEFEIQLPRTFRRTTRSDKKQDSLYEDLPTMDDIKFFLNYVNTTYKVLTLMGVSSGMSRAELRSLTFKHFYDSISLVPYPKTMDELLIRIEEIEDKVPLWRVTRIKTGKDYFTFSSPEAFDMIKEYLKELNRNFPNYNPEPEDILIRNKDNEPLLSPAITYTFRSGNRRAGFKKVEGYLYIRPHILRKIFASTLEKYKMPHLMIRQMMGHTIDAVTGAYFKNDPQTVKEEYLTILDHLTTNKVEIKLINQYDDLSEKLDQKEEEIKNLKAEKDEEMAKMNKRLELMEQLLSDGEVRKELGKRDI